MLICQVYLFSSTISILGATPVGSSSVHSNFPKLEILDFHSLAKLLDLRISHSLLFVLLNSKNYNYLVENR